MINCMEIGELSSDLNRRLGQTHQHILGVKEMCRLRKQIARSIQLDECRRGQAHRRAARYDRSQNNLHCCEFCARLRGKIALTEHENRCVHRNHIRSDSSFSCEWIFRTRATSDPALRYAAINELPYGLPRGSFGWSFTALAKKPLCMSDCMCHVSPRRIGRKRGHT